MEMFPRTHVPRAGNLRPRGFANSAKWQAGGDLYDNSLMHHLGHDRPTNSPPYAWKCSHGHMYHVLETFRRADSPTRLSCTWRRVVRQLSDAPPRARPTDKFPSIRTKMCTRTHVPRAGNLPPRGIAQSAKWRRGSDLYDNSLIHHLGHDRPSISSPYAWKCSHGHMYHVLETFGRAKSPTRLSCRWSRLVRQLSDAPPRARSTVNLHSIRTEMCPRTHVPCARHLHPCGIAHSAKWPVEPTCTTTL